jgi:putative NADPH-quinone reductase
MNILIVYAHPEPKSMNGAMYHTAIRALEASGHQVKTSDLYAAQFNPVSDRANFISTSDPAYYKQQLEEIHATAVNGFAADIEREQEKAEWCDLMIWQFPLWWFSVPAILKGWVDRVFAMGRFYKHGHIYETGVFQGKKALLSLTTGGASDAYVKDGFNGDLYGILRPLHRGIMEFTGFSVLQPQVVYGPVKQSGEERSAELRRWEERLLTVFEEDPISVGDY